jgi:HPt (histidine-containing phosphotransfer) domain-containing protein
MVFEHKLPSVDEVAGLMGLPPAVARRLLSMAPDRLTAILIDIRAAMEIRDWDAICKHTHAARGVCSNLRLQPIVDVAAAIEGNAKKRSASAEDEDLCDVFENLTQELRRMLSGGV